MSELKGLKKPVKLKKDLANMLNSQELPRTEILQKIWEYIKKNELQTPKENGRPEGKGRFIVLDKTLLSIAKNTFSTNKKGKTTDFRKHLEGQTIHMLDVATVIGSNIE